MELRSIGAIERVSKSSLNKVHEGGVHSDHKMPIRHGKSLETEEQVKEELARALSEIPTFKNYEGEPLDLFVISEKIKNGDYKPNLLSLAEKLLDII